MHESIVKIMEPGTEQGASGVVVGPEEVVTCFHVVRQAAEEGQRDAITVVHGIGEDQHCYNAEILRADESHDLCVLRVPGLKASPVALTESPPQLHDFVTAIGFPKGEYQETHGVIEHFNRADDHPIIFSSAYTTEGCSGGALLNAEGKLVGMPGPPINGAALPLEWIKKILSRTDAMIVESDDVPRTEMDYFYKCDRIAYGNRHLQREKYQSAVDWAAQRPESFFALYTLAEYMHYAQSASCDMTPSIDAIEKACALNPSVAALRMAATLWYELGEYKKSTAFYQQLIEKDRKYAEEYAIAIRFNATDLPAEQWLDALDNASAYLNPLASPAIFNFLGKGYLEVRDFENAARVFRQCISLPKEEFEKIDLSINLGLAEIELGNQEAAREVLLQANVARIYHNTYMNWEKNLEFQDRIETLCARLGPTLTR